MSWSVPAVSETWLPILETWLVAGATVLGAIVAGLIVHRTLFAAAERMARSTGTKADDLLARHARRPAAWMIGILALFLALRAVVLPADVEALARQVLSLALTAGLGWLAIALTGAFEDWVAHTHPVDQADNLRQRQVRTRVKVLRRLTVAAIAVVTLCLILMSFPSVRQIGISLLASAGVAGLVIGMAARPALSNLIAGLQLALTDPIRIDDVVIVEGQWGWVEEINTTYVVVRIWDLRRLVVPLSYFLEHPIENWTRRTADILGTVTLHADYTVPIGALRAELKRVLDQSGLWDGKTWGLQVTEAGERTVTLRALMSAPDGGRAWDLRCHVRESLLVFLQREHPDALPRTRVLVEDRHTDADAASTARTGTTPLPIP